MAPGTLRCQVTRRVTRICGCSRRFGLDLACLLHLLRAKHEVVLEHAPLVGARGLHGLDFATVLAAVEVARVVELLVATHAVRKVLLIVVAGSILRRQWWVARLLGLAARYTALSWSFSLARPQDGR